MSQKDIKRTNIRKSRGSLSAVEYAVAAGFAMAGVVAAFVLLSTDVEPLLRALRGLFN